jgi:hypothetical protein
MSINIEQPTAVQTDTVSAMASEIRILDVEKDGEDGVIVTFSDGTVGGCVVEELLELRPIREKAKTPKARTAGQKPPTQL